MTRRAPQFTTLTTKTFLVIVTGSFQGKLDFGKGTNSAISTNQALYLGSIVGVAHSASVDGGFIAGAVCASNYSTASSNSAWYHLQFPTVLGSSAAM